MRHVTVLLGDPTLPDRTKPGGRYTEDDYLQVEKLKTALGSLQQWDFDYIAEHDGLLTRWLQNPPEFVLNFCDTGYRNDARFELHIPALLELLGIPYSGSGPLALGQCYDKGLVRAVAASAGVPVPSEVFVASGDELPEFSYPAFVKPNRGDGSVGITPRSIVSTAAEAAATVDELRRSLPGCDVLLQEYLGGEEYGLGVIGNSPNDWRFLPVMYVDYSALPPQLPRLLDYQSKVDPTSPYWTDVKFTAAKLPESTEKDMQRWCALLFERLQLRDYARFDFRADSQGRVKLLEVNPNPAWCWDGKLAHMGALDGMTHAEVLAAIIEAALRRLGMTS